MHFFFRFQASEGRHLGENILNDSESDNENATISVITRRNASPAVSIDIIIDASRIFTFIFSPQDNSTSVAVSTTNNDGQVQPIRTRRTRVPDKPN